MTIILILFSISLLGIIAMLGRKWTLLKAGNLEVSGAGEHPIVSDLKKFKGAAGKSARRYGYLAVVATVRFYVRSLNFLKSKADSAVNNIKKLTHERGEGGEMVPKQDVNKFLKIVSDYKNKIRHIKHQVSEEEEKNL